MPVKTYEKTDSRKLSEHFAVSEFVCHGSGCCDKVSIDDGLVASLQKIRNHFERPVTINSGYRCEAHNNAIGGAASSYHTKGMAADIVVQGVKPVEVARYAESIGILGIGLYEDFVHIDTRTVKSFWYGHGEACRSTFANTYQLTHPYLQKGDRGEHVKALQQLLAANGCGCGDYGADGDFGADTDSAVREYQKKAGLAVDGCVGAATMGSLLGVRSV